MTRAEQLNGLLLTIDHARDYVREEWMADLWPDAVAAATLETLTDAAIEVIHLRDALVENN